MTARRWGSPSGCSCFPPGWRNLSVFLPAYPPGLPTMNHEWGHHVWRTSPTPPGRTTMPGSLPPPHTHKQKSYFKTPTKNSVAGVATSGRHWQAEGRRVEASCDPCGSSAFLVWLSEGGRRGAVLVGFQLLYILLAALPVVFRVPQAAGAPASLPIHHCFPASQLSAPGALPSLLESASMHLGSLFTGALALRCRLNVLPAPVRANRWLSCLCFSPRQSASSRFTCVLPPVCSSLQRILQECPLICFPALPCRPSNAYCHAMTISEDIWYAGSKMDGFIPRWMPGRFIGQAHFFMKIVQNSRLHTYHLKYLPPPLISCPPKP